MILKWINVHQNIRNKGSLFVIKDRTLVVADLSKREVVVAGIYLVYYDSKMWIKKAKEELVRVVAKAIFQ